MGGRGVARAACVVVCLGVGVVALAVACEARPPPNTALRPEGNGWFCWRNERIHGSSSCQRTMQACVASRGRVVGTKEGADSAKYTDCSPQPSAGCFTHKSAAGVESWYCAASYDDCESIARTVSRDPEQSADYEEMSRCEVW